MTEESDVFGPFGQPHTRCAQAFFLSEVIGKYMEWDKWCDKIPPLKFDSNWEVRVIPPYAGAIARFIVNKAGETHRVSVYLDCYDDLGWKREPYWEVYPYCDGDTRRVGMNNTGELIEAIRHALDNPEKEEDDDSNS